ncbi:class I SAM-dependent methyltransferase [Streptomyces sp. NPDC058417]|uniref:class I SAM-dependent methyltransferase n=1 Tax=unclassified Streptomyces TaxID=2593676 RepID=UPI003650CCC2
MTATPPGTDPETGLETTPATTPDLWHDYGRARAGTDREVPERFRWTWGQDSGPGAEVLGDLDGACVADLGAGAGRHAAYLAVRHRPARVDAVDSSPAQRATAAELYGHLGPRLRIVPGEVAAYLRTVPAAYDVLYSVFGAVDFTDPQELLPAAATALRPGGRLVFSTLAHCVTGVPARTDGAPGRVAVTTPDGVAATLPRWVLTERVWVGLLGRAGFTDVAVEAWPATAEGPRRAATLLVSARRPT